MNSTLESVFRGLLSSQLGVLNLLSDAGLVVELGDDRLWYWTWGSKRALVGSWGLGEAVVDALVSVGGELR